MKPTMLDVASDGVQQVEGRLIFEHGLIAGGVPIRLYHRGFGGAEKLLGETETDAHGHYAILYARGSGVANLEVRAVDTHGAEVPLSATKFNAGTHELLDLVAPTRIRPLAAEYQRLSRDLAREIGEGWLGAAREDQQRRDLTLLHQATGWDARLIALAAIAEKRSAESNIPPQALYGLLRTGLPAEKQAIARFSVAAVETALGEAQAAGIISLDQQQMAEARAAFEAFARETLRSSRAPGALSSFGELLERSGLGLTERQQFEDIYFAHGGPADELWEQARAAGLPDATIDRLRLQSKLAYLTRGSADLIQALQQEIESPDNLGRLVEMDLYREADWKVWLKAMAAGDEEALKKLIPPAYAGERAADRLDAYAADLARQVRLAFPTRVVERMIANDELGLGDAYAALKRPVATFLRNAEGLGFVLGRTPLDSFVAQHREKVLANIDKPQHEATLRSARRVLRLYQIAPTLESLPTLSDLGFDSAYDVATFTENEFVERYGQQFESAEQAKLVVRKAQQITMVAYNLATTAKLLDSTPAVYALSSSAERRQQAKAQLIKHYPSMETMFGSLDYCECEQCHSVLSPAAYLVDLLGFLDLDQKAWLGFLEKWKKEHGNEPYDGPVYRYQKPFDILAERRPDLLHLPLTCENTNTALPYIDMVNEVLEYFVANGNLGAEAAYDTGASATPELLAEPQHILPEAYNKLNGREARYPLLLPFDLWLETVRRFFEYFDTPLWRVLETFRHSDNLFAPGQPFARASIFIESLGLSPAEAAIFTNPDPLATWHELYGFKSAQEAMTIATDPQTGQRIDLNSAKALARRLGVTYTELVDILQTDFINPQRAGLVFLDKIGLSIKDASFYLNNNGLLEMAEIEGEEGPIQVPAFTLDSELSATGLQLLWDMFFEVGAIADRLGVVAAALGVTMAEIDARLAEFTFHAILVLAGLDAGCDFDKTALQFADARPVDGIVFLKINLFVRLWRKLGWRIEETDRALQVFVPTHASFQPAHLAKQPLQTALFYLAHLKTLDEQVGVGTDSRLKLITLWSDIATTGQNPLYAQLFLTRSVQQRDKVFEHPEGKYLQHFDTAGKTYKPFHWSPGQPEDPATGNVSLKSHLLAVQGALMVTSEEVGHMLADAQGKPLAEAAAILEQEPLTLATVSLIYRYGLLAKALNLSIRELIGLKQLASFEPFKSLHPDPLETIEQDHPFSQTLRFLEVAEEVRASGLTIDDLDYLLRHRFDKTGKYRPNPDGTLALLKTLAVGIRAIQAEHAIPADAGATNDEVLRHKLGLALPPDVVERFLAMMNGMAEFIAAKVDVEPADALKPATFADEPRIRQLNYKERPHQEQKLTFRGVLFDLQMAELQQRFDTALTAPQKRTFAALLGDVKAQARKIFDDQLKKQKLRLDGEAGFLDEEDYDRLFKPLKLFLTLLPGDSQQESDNKRRENEKIARANQAEVQNRCYRVAQAFLPYLQQRLIRQFIVQTLTGYTAADPLLVESLLIDERLLAAPQTLLEAFAALGQRGISVLPLITSPIVSEDESGTPPPSPLIVPSVDTAQIGERNQFKDLQFAGYLEVPAPGAYRFFVELEAPGTEAKLHFEHLPQPLFLTGMVAASDTTTVLGSGPKEYLELRPNTLYRFSLHLPHLHNGEARLLVQGETVPKGSLAQLALYPLAAMDRAERAAVLLTKALQLVQSFGLSEREIRYLLTHPAEFDGLSLSKLPTAASDDTSAGAKALFEQFLRLAAYARLKRDLAGSTDDLIGIFEANGTKDLNTTYPLIAKLTRRDEAMVQMAATALVSAPTNPNFDSEKPLQQLWEALQVVGRLGVPVGSVARWVSIISPDADQQQRFAIARDLRDTLKARFEPEAWQRVAQRIFDKLRQRQRDALVAYVMRQKEFDSVEQLFEYFLIDPGMEPVVQTSRVRLAISSVQTFVQRCLLNLEPKAPPSAIINAQHWQWMKRYRVWEANRKIFLFPENWLEPEFRDDKSHLFQELEGALLQGDMSNDLAEDAFFHYLKGLETLARLEMVAMYQEKQPNVLHLIGRTFNVPRKYFYRRYVGQIWTPWEPVNTDIEGDQVVAVVWRQRLHLFWLTFLVKAKGKTDGSVVISTSGDSVEIPVDAPREVEVQLNWSEYFQGQWTTREAGGFGNPLKRDVTSQFTAGGVFVHASMELDKQGQERAVQINLTGTITGAFRIVGKNSPLDPGARALSVWDTPYYSDTLSLNVKATEYIVVESDAGLSINDSHDIAITSVDIEAPGRPILNKPLASGAPIYTLLQPSAMIEDEANAFDSLLDDYERPPAGTTITDVLFAYDAAESKWLRRPFFYQDSQHTFFVEPTLIETSRPNVEVQADAAEGSANIIRIGSIETPTRGVGRHIFNNANTAAMGAGAGRTPAVLVMPPPEPLALFVLQPGEDWVTAPNTTIRYGPSRIGASGRIDGPASTPSTGTRTGSEGERSI